MNMPFIITVVVVTLLAAMVVAMIVVQARHKANMERLQRIQYLNTQNKKLKHIQRSLLPQFRSPEIDDFIYQSLIQNFKVLIKLNVEKADYLKSDLEQINRERAAAKANPQAGSVGLTLESANICRSTLKTLYETVKDSYEKKRIVASEAETLIQQIEGFMMQAAIQFYQQQIDSHRERNRYKEAIHFCTKLIDLLRNHKKASQYKQEIIATRAAQKNLQTEWKGYREQNLRNSNESLEDSMANWLESTDDWKKTNDYD